MRKIVLIAGFVLISILLFSFITGCDEGEQVDSISMEKYRNCTAACASVMSDDFTTQHYCHEECRKKFLE